MLKNEDVAPTKYTYSWSSESDISLQDFLAKYKPSMVQNDGTKPWIWVRGSEPATEDNGEEEAAEEANKLLKEVTDRVEAIKNDASIPMRSSKKTGAKSKKEVREQVQADATEKLKAIATKHGFVSGKWLIFAPAEKIDVIWSGIATSLVSGPLASTSAYLAKVATSPEQESPHHQHLICVYLPNVYDKDKVTEVMKVLLRNHGVNLSGVKCSLYTTIGIDSKHPSGISSTIWKNSALLSEKESKELKDSFFGDLASNKTVAPEQSTTKADAAPAAVSSKPKPKLKKKVADDPFASENDDDDEEKERREEVQAKTTGKAEPKPKKKVANDPSASDDDAENEKTSKEEVKVKKSSSTSKRKQDSEDDDGEDRPKKRRSRRAAKQV